MKKEPVFTRTLAARVAYGEISKAHLFDLAFDLMRSALNGDETEAEVLTALAERSAVVALHRKDRAFDPKKALTSAIRRCRKQSPKHAAAYESALTAYLASQ